MSDVFHAISQPLTALRCLLDLALLKDDDVASYRAALREAAAYTEAVIGSVEFLRELAACDDPGTPSSTELSSLIKKTAEELAPLFEFNQVNCELLCEYPVRLFADPEKVQKAMFLALDYGAAEFRELRLETKPPAKLELAFGVAVLAHPARSGAARSLELAERIFAATGANVALRSTARGQLMTVCWNA